MRSLQFISFCSPYFRIMYFTALFSFPFLSHREGDARQFLPKPDFNYASWKKQVTNSRENPWGKKEQQTCWRLKPLLHSLFIIAFYWQQHRRGLTTARDKWRTLVGFECQMQRQCSAAGEDNMHILSDVHSPPSQLLLLVRIYDLALSSHQSR